MPGCFNMMSFQTDNKQKGKGLPWKEMEKKDNKLGDVSMDESLKKIKSKSYFTQFKM